MLLKSSSTPVLGSLLSSASSLCFSDSPINSHHHHLPSSTTFHSFPTSCHSSPVSDRSDHSSASLGFRRTRSDGSLRSLLPDSSDEPHHQPTPLRSSTSRRNTPVLERIPSFSIYSSNEDLLEEEEEEEEVQEYFHDLSRCVTNRDSIAGGDNNASEDQNGFSFPEISRRIGAGSGGFMLPLFLARGLGIDRIGSGLLNAGGGCSGGGGGGNCSVMAGNGGDQADVELYFKKMVDENPSNALFLRNYAEFLDESKGDLKRAEEYYSRAILADPGDGEILSKYAKMVWRLHQDQERASEYFQQAVRVAPSDSHVLAAYAGFLWETEDADGDENAEDGWSQDFILESVHRAALASATV